MNINLLVNDLNQVLNKYGINLQFSATPENHPNPHSDALPNGLTSVQDTPPNTHPEPVQTGGGQSAIRPDLERKQNNLRRLLGQR